MRARASQRGQPAGSRAVGGQLPPLRRGPTRSRYCPVRVSILIVSPTLMNSGTLMVAPVAILAGLVAPVAVSPRKPGSVSTIFCSMKFGRVTPTARPLEEQHVDHDLLGHEQRIVADGLAGDGHLVVGGGVHEHEGVAVLVEVLHVLDLDVGGLHLFAGADVPLDARCRVSRFLNLVRVKAAPLPGLTNWNSTTVHGEPSIITLRPLRMSDVS